MKLFITWIVIVMVVATSAIAIEEVTGVKVTRLLWRNPDR